MQKFRAAVEAGDIAAVADLLAEDVTFLSPAAFAPYRGKPLVHAVLGAAFATFENFRYVRAIGDPAGDDTALVFEASIGDRSIVGCDFIRLDDDGLIDEFMVMIRPLSGLQAVAEAMSARFAAIQGQPAPQ